MRILAIALILFFSSASICGAAFKSSSDEISPQAAWNPAPLPDDILLPMPCGLSLALRPVDVSSGSLLRDKKFSMGITEALNQDRQIYERRFDGYIAAPFTLSDLPATWKKKLKDVQSEGDGLYFIGKYEVSNQQWRAVMDALDRDGTEIPAQCPKLEQASTLPVANISWFDAQEFLAKYNAWLVRAHLETLPSFKGGKEVAFFRLPTEEEWEYAARAYPKVPQEWWANNDTFRFDEGREFKDYAVTSDDSTKSAPLPIGSRLANPLGLHDSAGNVSEMVDGFFRMSIADMANGQIIRRLHGAAGGILTKGGSFRSQKEESLPGYRDEIPVYSPAGANKRSDLGFRVVLSAVNIPNAQRLEKLRKEANRQISPARSKIEGNTPAEMLGAMIASAEGQQKADLERLRGLVQDQEAAFASQDLKNLEHVFRSLLYEMESLRAYGLRYSQALSAIEKLNASLKTNISQEEKKNTREAIAIGKRDADSYKQSLMLGAGHFKNTVETITDYPEAELARLFRQIQKEYAANTIADMHMRQNLLQLAKIVALARQKGSSVLTPRYVLGNVLPEVHFKRITF